MVKTADNNIPGWWA